MSGQAEVRSIDVLVDVKSAVVTYKHESAQALSEVEQQARRAVDYICIDRAAFWKNEVRRSYELVNEAQKDLEHCRTFKKVDNNQPSCFEETKRLEKAKARLAATEKKFEAVRRWSPIVQQQFREASVRLVHFQERLDSDLPKGLARLERMVRSLDSYREVSSPVGGSSPEGGATGPRVTRSLDEAPAAQTPVTPETIAVPPQSPAPPVT